MNARRGNSAALRILGIGESESLADAMQAQNWTMLREDGSVLPVFVQLVREREAWKISRFHFGAPPPGQEEWEI